MRGERPSITAAVVAAMRALYTRLPAPYRLAPDPLAEQLVPSPVGAAVRALALAPAPLVHRALGAASLGLSFHIPLRTRAIDDAVHESVRAGATQLVVLGAGLDTRAIRLDAIGDVRAFEIDHPSTQRYKVARLDAAGSPSPAAKELVRVAIDFERERLEDALPRAGFDREARSFWIWEGVTVYLTPEAIDASLRAIAALSPPGSRVALTYSEALGARARSIPGWTGPLALGGSWVIGEPFRTFLDRRELRARLDSAGFVSVSDESTLDWARRYWRDERGVRDVERLAIAEVRG